MQPGNIFLAVSWPYRQQEIVHMSQLLRVEPSTQARGLPAIGWWPARRDGLGATHGVWPFILFFLWVGSTWCDWEGGSCFVLYSDPLWACRHTSASWNEDWDSPLWWLTSSMANLKIHEWLPVAPSGDLTDKQVKGNLTSGCRMNRQPN